MDRLAGLDLGWFIVLGIVGALGDAPGMAAREALLPAIARHGGQPLYRLVSLRESISALMIVLGPGLAGLLISRFDGTTVLWITASTSALAAISTACLPRLATDPETQTGSVAPASFGGMIRETSTGLRFLLGQPLLRAVTILSLFVVAVLGALQGILLPVVFTEQGHPRAPRHGS